MKLRLTKIRLLISGILIYLLIRYFLPAFTSTEGLMVIIFVVVVLGLILVQWASNKDRNRVDRWFPRRNKVEVNVTSSVAKAPQLPLDESSQIGRRIVVLTDVALDIFLGIPAYGIFEVTSSPEMTP